MTVRKIEVTYVFEDQRIDPQNEHQMKRVFDALHDLAVDHDYPVWWDLPEINKDIYFGLTSDHTDEELIKVINTIKEHLD